MTRAHEFIRGVRAGIEDAIARVLSRPVHVGFLGTVGLAAIQITTGELILGRSTQEAVANVCELLVIVGLGDMMHRDVERLPHEGKR